MSEITKDNIEKILSLISDNLQISKTEYDNAVKSYKSVGEWLAHESSPLHPFKPEILPQGSFLLGTIIKPIEDNIDIDLDLVCRLHGKDEKWTQYNLKNIIGNRLKESQTYNQLLEKEGRRCWTLKYANSSNFHMDILPSLVAKDYEIIQERAASLSFSEQNAALGIRITDRLTDNYLYEKDPDSWPKSNPFGYANWFNTREVFSNQFTILSERKVHPIKEFKKDKSILVKVIQLLKRHRDIVYGADEDKPVSIILTTLAAQAYGGEDTIYLALINIIDKMSSFIENRYDDIEKKYIKWVQNPVDDEENFADKWKEVNRKKDTFYKWLEQLHDDFIIAFRKQDSQAIMESLAPHLGRKLIREAANKLGEQTSLKTSLINERQSLFVVPHRQKPLWEIVPQGKVTIHGSYKEKNKWNYTDLGDFYIPKECSIIFRATTNIPPPFDVYWQVVNTGNEAKSRYCLRGEIFHSKTAGTGGLQQNESSLYHGVHWIECFIIKNNICVARSGEFIVRID